MSNPLASWFARCGGASLVAQAIAVAALAFGPALAADAPPPPPKLIVAISVDQFGANLFDQWRGAFSGGFGRLLSGVVYPSGYQSHAATETCPGHSTLLTGKHPNKTGIVANTYRDPNTGKPIYCLFDTTTVLAQGGDQPSVGPQRLMATTLGEWLKAASPQSRVVAVSGKDRGAINMAGHRPDGVFWLQPGFGFTTYISPGEDAAARLAPMAGLNAKMARTWTERPRWPYAHKDCRAREAVWTLGQEAWRSTLPPTGWGVSDKPADVQRDVMASPIADDLTLAGARQLIDHFKLGRGPATDLLAVSFSATDFVGHRFGSDGPEMCENLHRLDATLGALFAALDATGAPYLVVLSADHGGSDFPERLRAKGYDQAARVNGKAVLERANKAVMAELNLTAPPLKGAIEEVDVVAPAGVDEAVVIAAGARAIAAQPEVAAAFTQAELLATVVPPGKAPDEMTLRERFALSTYPGRSPDISAALKPYTAVRSAAVGGSIAGHGSAWNYDRRVPILFWWKGAPHQERPLPIETVDIAPTLAAILGLAPPADIDGRCLPLGLAGCPATP